MKENIYNIYNISDSFYNNDIKYPFNIFDEKDNFIEDYSDVIDRIITKFRNDREDNKKRFIWISAEGYCQTEVFLKKILLPFGFPVLYLHWLDYVNNYGPESTNPICSEISKQTTSDNTYFKDISGLKICVIDHAEEITNFKHIIELHNSQLDFFLFIFISKNKLGLDSEKKRWKEIVKLASEQELGHILRSESNLFTVKRYSIEMCKKILKSTIGDQYILDNCCDKINTIVDDMRRVLYFDLMLSQIKICSSIDDLPNSFADESFINEVYKNASKGFVQNHIKYCKNLEEFIERYMNSDFVNDFPLGEQQRLPLDAYVWANGIIDYSPQTSHPCYQENIKYLFDYYEKNISAKSFDAIQEISKLILCNTNTNNSFSKEAYLVALATHSLYGAKFCAEILSDNNTLKLISKEILYSVFVTICNIYKQNIESVKDINIFRLLGMEIGKILPNIPNNIVEKSLNCFFKEIHDDYVYPICNDNGISAIPITNFEFQKFVNDSGYETYYQEEINIPLNNIAVEYYKDIFKFIISSLNRENKKGKKCLANILKGYDWMQFKQIAYLYSQRNSITIEKIYNAIQNKNYPHPLTHPAKWKDKYNSDIRQPFCNPLQPVVCINLFEARAYTKWLSEKIRKPVRVLTYDPDYISIIGTIKHGLPDQQRQNFLAHTNKNELYINTVENSNWFYGSEDIEIKEPNPIAIPNSYFSGIYDFLGNVFETQDTQYSYNYSDSWNREVIKKFEEKDIMRIDYNCPGGGLQRTKANLPPEYMGQVPAFLRNQDIGFRIVIDGKNKSGVRSKNNLSLNIEYSDSKRQTFEKVKTSTSVLSNICILGENYMMEEVSSYSNEEKEISLYAKPKEVNNHAYNEYIMLVSDKESIFAYYLSPLTSLIEENQELKISMLVKTPSLPKELALRRKCKNIDLADWIDLLEIHNENETKFFSVRPINISNGFFSVSEHNIRKNIANGIIKRKESDIVGNYTISFLDDRCDFRNCFYNSIKNKLGTSFFLPDWIDIVDFIEYISSKITLTPEPNDDIVMAAITTIDTSDLHEKINEKHLEEINKELVENNIYE